MKTGAARDQQERLRLAPVSELHHEHHHEEQQATPRPPRPEGAHADPASRPATTAPRGRGAVPDPDHHEQHQLHRVDDSQRGTGRPSDRRRVPFTGANISSAASQREQVHEDNQFRRRSLSVGRPAAGQQGRHKGHEEQRPQVRQERPSSVSVRGASIWAGGRTTRTRRSHGVHEQAGSGCPAVSPPGDQARRPRRRRRRCRNATICIGSNGTTCRKMNGARARRTSPRPRATQRHDPQSRRDAAPGLPNRWASRVSPRPSGAKASPLVIAASGGRARPARIAAPKPGGHR